MNELPVLKLSSQMQDKKNVLIARAEDILDSASDISSDTFSNGDNAQNEPNEYETVLNEAQFEGSEYEVPNCEGIKIPSPSKSHYQTHGLSRPSLNVSTPSFPKNPS